MATLKRLEALEQSRGQRKIVALFPKLVSLDRWSVLSESMQAELKANVKTESRPSYSQEDLSAMSGLFNA